MDITSSLFLLFVFPIILIISTMISNKLLSNVFLVILSIVFYMFGAKMYFIILIVQIYLTFFSMKFIQGLRSLVSKKIVLSIHIILVVSLLIFYKYAAVLLNFTAFQDSGILSKLILPLGLSYYTFKSISAVSDVYLKKTKVIDFISVALYISYFPEIVSGPITLYRDFAPQIKNRKQSSEQIKSGFQMILIGLFKKLVVADSLSFTVNKVFSKELSNLGTHIVWLGVLYYSIQLYFDFSGYSNVSIGISKVLGFDMKKNFNNPYRATSITDFWRRWHISLSTWFREYIYIPLGGEPKRFRQNILKSFYCVFNNRSLAWIIFKFPYMGHLARIIYVD